MMRCILSTEWGQPSYRRIREDPDYIGSWNAICESVLALRPWVITNEDVQRASEPGQKDYAHKFCSDVTARLSYDEMCEVGRLQGVVVKFHPDESSMIVRLEERVRALGMRLHEIERPEALAQGAAAVIHVPDQSLLYIDEVTYETDCCTDHLSEMLDEGWRILAVCPPCSQRRPDYILGRRRSGRPLPLAQE